MKSMLWAIVICLLLGMTCKAEIVRVVRIIDGDTFECEDGRHIRIHGIDCPERRQSYGDRASRWLSVLILDREVELSRISPAGWGRTAALVTWRDIDVGKYLVNMGYAWVSDEYVGDLADAYNASQNDAQAAQRGLWKDATPIPPWDWRKGVRASPVSAQPVIHDSVNQNPQPVSMVPQNQPQSYQGTICVGPT